MNPLSWEDFFQHDFNNDGYPTPSDPNAPVFTSPASANVAENTSGTVYTATATDTDTPVTFALGSSKDEGLFSITSSGALSFSSAPDFEAPADSYGVAGDNLYQVDIIATDNVGSQSTHSLDLSVTNINDNAPTITSSSNLSVQTGVVGTIYAASVTDADGDTATFSLGSAKDEGLFNITANGALSFINPPDYNNPTDAYGTPGDNIYHVDIIADDGNQSDTQEVSITVSMAPVMPIIEQFGDVTLYKSDTDGFYYFGSSSDNTLLKISGQGVGEIGAWNLISIEDTGTGTFKGMWKNGNNQSYILWDISANGSYVSHQSVNPLSWEDFFQHDFNNDTII